MTDDKKPVCTCWGEPWCIHGSNGYTIETGVQGEPVVVTRAGEAEMAPTPERAVKLETQGVPVVDVSGAPPDSAMPIRERSGHKFGVRHRDPGPKVEVLPGIFVHKHIIDAAVLATTDAAEVARVEAQLAARDKERAEVRDMIDHGVPGAFADTKPLAEHQIEELQAMMGVRKHVDVDMLPDEIVFAIPNVDLPTSSDVYPGALKVEMTTARYVLRDSMPPELQAVVRAYLSLRRGPLVTSFCDELQRFKQAVSDLNDRAQQLVDDKPKASTPS
jgi:hypothetical protein